MTVYPISAGGVTTRVLEALPDRERKSGTIVFVHGLGSRADRFCHNLKPLANAGHRVVALDLPGHGFADKGALPYGVPYYADFLRAALEALEIDDPILVGSSLGGNIAARVAIDRPDLVRALILVGAVGLIPLGPELRQAASESVLASGTREGIERKLRRLFFSEVLVTESLVREELAFATAPGAAEGLAVLCAYIRDRVDEDVFGAELATAPERPPTLLVWGAEDRPVPLPVARRAATELEIGDLVVIDDAGHAPYYERPEIFNGLLMEFIARKGTH